MGGLVFVFACVVLMLARGDATLIPTSRGVVATGQLCCSQNGNCPGTGVPGAVVTLRCSSLLILTSVVGQNTTDANGFFSITAPTAPASVLGLPSTVPCIATVQLPLNATLCPVLADTSGVLNGILTPAGTVADRLLGILQAVRVSVFFRFR